MRSNLILAAAAVVFVLFLLKNRWYGEELVRDEQAAAASLRRLAKGPPCPPKIEGGYRFEWVAGGELPPVLVALSEGGVCVLAAGAESPVYAYDVFDAVVAPDVTPLRAHLAGADKDPPPGWRRLK